MDLCLETNPLNIVEDATDSSNQASEKRSGLVKKYIEDCSSAPINAKKSKLEHYLEEPQFPFE